MSTPCWNLIENKENKKYRNKKSQKNLYTCEKIKSFKKLKKNKNGKFRKSVVSLCPCANRDRQLVSLLQGLHSFVVFSCCCCCCCYCCGNNSSSSSCGILRNLGWKKIQVNNCSAVKVKDIWMFTMSELFTKAIAWARHF